MLALWKWCLLLNFYDDDSNWGSFQQPINDGADSLCFLSSVRFLLTYVMSPHLTEICFYWLCACCFSIWCVLFSVLLIWSFHSFSLFLNICQYFCVRVCTFFFLPSRKTQWYHWAPTHKLSALHSQRRMLSPICPTQKITVRPPPLSLYYTWSADYLLSFCFTFLSPCCQLDSSSTVCIYTLTRVSHFLNGLVCCLFRQDKALLNRARWSHATK